MNFFIIMIIIMGIMFLIFTLVSVNPPAIKFFGEQGPQLTYSFKEIFYKNVVLTTPIFAKIGVLTTAIFHNFHYYN